MALLNLSHHPHSGWSKKQLQAARKYGEIIDLPYPIVDPLSDTQGIAAQAMGLFFQILQMQELHEQPLTIHLAGEMTLTYALLRLLREEGIPCVASTSKREVEEKDGKKVVTFDFKQFRGYW